jgi:hypothetical protein
MGPVSGLRIWKFPLAIVDEQVIGLPKDAEILSVQFQGPQLCLWALLDTEAPKQMRLIRIIGTGNPAPDDLALWTFLGTVQQGYSGLPTLVWHVFVQQ